MKITNKWCVLIMEVAFKTMPPYIWWQLHGAMWVSDAIQFCFHNFLVYLNKLENNSFHQLILYLFKTSEITVANILKISPIFSFYRIRLQYYTLHFCIFIKMHIGNLVVAVAVIHSRLDSNPRSGWAKHIYTFCCVLTVSPFSWRRYHFSTSFVWLGRLNWNRAAQSRVEK